MSLLFQDCSPLSEKITRRVSSWSSDLLSFARRLQLNQNILLSIQVFWSSVFILPKKVVKAIEQKLNSFLWKSLGSSTVGAKVSLKKRVVWVEERGRVERNCCHEVHFDYFLANRFSLGCLC